MKRIAFALALTTAALAATGCTVHQTEAPALTGPSEFALSLSMSASPDTLSQDGRSTSTIVVTARDVNGKPLANVSLRLDMRVDGQAGDFGTLSNRTVSTGSDGRASVVYTAPAPPPVGASAGICSGNIMSGAVPGRCVLVVATTIGGNYTTTSSSEVLIRLVPTGAIVPSFSTPAASFTTAPSAPTANVTVQFDASGSCATQPEGTACPATNRIVRYDWDFGDGVTATGARVGHAFTRQQTYAVTLTIVNDLGIAGSVTKYIDIGAGAVPTTAFVFSPTAPIPGDTIYFDAQTSKPGAGHAIVRYVWNWGDGTEWTDTASPAASHRYDTAGTYVVTLTVADETGQTATATNQVKVAAPAP